MKPRLALLAALPLLTVSGAPPVPVAAQEACATWSAEMLEDEGGPVLTAWACDAARPDAQLLLSCASNQVWISYDLSAGAEVSSDLDETVDVTFTTSAGSVSLPMSYQAMDARHAGNVATSSPLVALLRGGDSVAIRDAEGRYPARSLSLAGSSAAIGKLLADCL